MLASINIFHYVDPYHEALAVMIAGTILVLGLTVWGLGLSYHMVCRDVVREREEDS